MTLLISLAVGVRWIIANQTPTYPVGEGVYAANTAPKWGAMTQPNAATFYMAATDTLDLKVIYSEEAKKKRTTSFITDEPVSIMKPYVEQAQPAFALLRQGMKYPYVRDYQTNYFKANPISTKGVLWATPDFIKIREMARLLACEASVRESKGDHSGAMNSSIDAIRLGTDVSKGHSLMEGLVGLLVQCIGENAAIDCVAKLSAPEARAAASRLEETLMTAPTFAEIVTQERDRGYETMQDIFRTGNISELKQFEIENGKSGLPLTGKKAHIIYDAAILYYTKHGLVNDYAAHQDQVLVQAKMPYYKAKQLPYIPEHADPFIRIIGTHPTKRAQLQATLITTREQVILARLAIQAYSGEHHNHPPQSLNELTTGTKPYLHAVPIDLFSVSGTAPLRYDSKAGVAYSVGDNGIDDGYSKDDNGVYETDKRTWQK